MYSVVFEFNEPKSDKSQTENIGIWLINLQTKSKQNLRCECNLHWDSTFGESSMLCGGGSTGAAKPVLDDGTRHKLWARGRVRSWITLNLGEASLFPQRAFLANIPWALDREGSYSITSSSTTIWVNWEVITGVRWWSKTRFEAKLALKTLVWKILQATECNKCHSRVLWTQCSLTSLVFFVR